MDPSLQAKLVQLLMQQRQPQRQGIPGVNGAMPIMPVQPPVQWPPNGGARG